MQLEVGKIYEGKVTGITKFGAFVEIDRETTGMVHISEVANTFVNEIKDHIQEGQTVKVKVLTIGDDKKISLSIKKAQDAPPRPQRPFTPRRDDNAGSGGNSGGYSGGNSGGNSSGGNRRPYENRRPNDKKSAPSTPESAFENMMSKFKQNSEEKMCDIKKNIDGKRKGGGRRPPPKPQ